MENHILQPITYEDVARALYVSSYHFHRSFSLVTGMTANEYIRNRRLSMAGQELILSDLKVIDMAYKYGYETPESFTKAFTRFHGVTPNVARRSSVELKLFNRLLIKIKLEGGIAMEYRIEKRKPFTLLAAVEEFRNESVSEEGNTDIPDFWKRCGEAGVFRDLKKETGQGDLYGVCAPISKESDYFKYGIGTIFQGTVPLEGYSLWEVKPSLWAVFKCMGENPDCIGDTWHRIFSEFLPGSDYQMLDDTDFELYSEDFEAGCFCEIWIPIEKKDK